MNEVDIPLSSLQAFQEAFSRIKAEWGPGPWQDEVDIVAWTEAESSYPCMAARNDMGCWVGYVGIAAEHPLHGACGADPVPPRLHAIADEKAQRSPLSVLVSALGIDRDANTDLNVAALFDVHGGITFSGKRGIAGLEGYWFFGFDCAHALDVVPAMATSFLAMQRFSGPDADPFTAKILADLRGDGDFKRHYRTLPYVREQAEGLARQLRSYALD